MRTFRFRPAGDDDAGVTMVELLIYIVISTLALVALAALFANAVRADATTRDRDRATDAAQLIVASVQSGIRNSSSFTVSTANVAGTVVPILRASVLTGSGTWTWQCRAWAVTAAGDFVSSNSRLADGSYTGWKALVAGARVEGALASGQPFVDNAPLLKLGLNVTVGSATVPVTSGVVRQTTGPGAPTC